MKVILINEDAFFELIDRVVEHINKNTNTKSAKWLTTEEAMLRLNISSKTTLQRYRDESMIRYSQLGRKIILYDSQSIDELLERNAQEPF